MTFPFVSVVLPAYRSQATIGGALSALQTQTYANYEVIVVDSSPDDATSRIVQSHPWVTFEKSPVRLYPHEARNRGVHLSRGELLVFTDPDVYAGPEWIEELVGAWLKTHEVIVGSLECHGDRLLDRAIHLCKFSKFLSGGEMRPIDVGPTANLLLTRADFDAVGGLHGDRYLADVALGRSLMALGRRLLFVPSAVVRHHHTQTPRAFFNERYQRGKLYGAMRSSWLSGKPAILAYLAASVSGARLLSTTYHVVRHSAGAGQLKAGVAMLPFILAGHAASIAGEAVEYARALAGKRA